MSMKIHSDNKLMVLQAAQVDYCAGILSVSAVARKHGIPDSTLRREALRLGWMRHSPENRRQLVADALRGEFPANEVVGKAVHQLHENAATEDAADFKKGLAVARKVLDKLLEIADLTDDPRELKTVVDANKAAIDTIVSVRALAQAPQPVTSAASKVTDGFAELRAAFASVIEKHSLEAT
jgi:transposase-like protein